MAEINLINLLIQSCVYIGFNLSFTRIKYLQLNADVNQLHNTKNSRKCVRQGSILQCVSTPTYALFLFSVCIVRVGFTEGCGVD
jgi:hypothetical protein